LRIKRQFLVTINTIKSRIKKGKNFSAARGFSAAKWRVKSEKKGVQV
jgi:hypothetical protein